MSHTALRAPCVAAAAAAPLASGRGVPAAAPAAALRVPRAALRALAAPRRAAAAPRCRRRHAAGAPASTRPEASLASDEADLFKPTGPRLSGVEIEVPRLSGRTAGGAARETVPSPFCTFSACALPSAPRSGPRNSVNLCHAFVSDDDRVMLKSIAYGNPTSAGAEDCDSECNFTPQWCAPRRGGAAAAEHARAQAPRHPTAVPRTRS
jgi:hypothetical protein